MRHQTKWFSVWFDWASIIQCKLDICDRQIPLVLSPTAISVFFYPYWKYLICTIMAENVTLSLSFLWLGMVVWPLLWNSGNDSPPWLKRKERCPISKCNLFFLVFLWECAHREATAIFWPQRMTPTTQQG